VARRDLVGIRDTSPMASSLDSHAHDTHEAGEGHHHDHPPTRPEHADHGAPLGPIDRAAWAAALGGSLVGVVVAFAFFLALSA
jgi:hypothetical protein